MGLFKKLLGLWAGRQEQNPRRLLTGDEELRCFGLRGGGREATWLGLQVGCVMEGTRIWNVDLGDRRWLVMVI